MARSTEAAHKPIYRKAWSKLLKARFMLFQRSHHDSIVMEWVGQTPVVVLPQVFNPKLFRTGAWFAQSLDAGLIPSNAAVLDMGTGSGVCAIFAARWARRVLAVDVNPMAVRCARINALVNQLESKIEVRQSNLFELVGDEQFDVVLFNPPFFRGSPKSEWDQAWRSDDVIQRFASSLRARLTPRGCALVLLSTDNDLSDFAQAFRSRGFEMSLIGQRDLINEKLMIYRFGGG